MSAPTVAEPFADASLASREADAAADDALGVRTFGDYELLEVIGAGGMGVVYRARHRALDRDVALKIVAEGSHEDFDGARFLDEARAAARLNHPNIVPVHAVGSVGGLNYIAMQLVEGEHLGHRLARGRLAAAEAIALLLPLCDALHYAHRLGVLHLDIKPANMLIDERGSPLVADFGLARRVGADGAAAGGTAGTPAYMSPESLRAGERLTAASDVYALGAVLFEMLAGISPHGREETAALVARARAGTLESLSAHRPDLSPDLAAVCLHCLELDPVRRYASAAELADDLRRVREGVPVRVRRPRLGERLGRWLQREPRFAAALAVALLATIVGALASFVMWQRAESARTRAELSAELGARLYVSGDPVETDFRSGEELMRWLDERLPGQPERQAEVLGEYSKALVDGKAGLRLHSLMQLVLRGPGLAYRRRVIETLAARGDAESLLHAAMLAYLADQDSEAAPQLPGLLVRALAAAPGSVHAWQVAATHCARRAGHEPLMCTPAHAAQRYAALESDNVYAWVALAASSEGDAARAALHEAARRTSLDDYYGADKAALRAALSRIDVPLPPTLVAMAAAYTTEPATAAVARNSWWTPDGVPRRLEWLCDPAAHPALDRGARADCLAVGLAFTRAKASITTNMAGVTVVRRLARGTPLEQEMIALRTRYLFMRESSSRFTAEQRSVTVMDEMEREIALLGELEAYERRLLRLGLPARPPPGWAPTDPNTLRLPEERTPPG